jgi:hypothetical protein
VKGAGQIVYGAHADHGHSGRQGATGGAVEWATAGGDGFRGKKKPDREAVGQSPGAGLGFRVIQGTLENPMPAPVQGTKEETVAG